MEVREIKLSDICTSTYQPRQYFNEQSLIELSRDIKRRGLKQPVVLRQKNGAYELIAGERRKRAAEMAGLQTIPAVIESLSDQETIEAALLENLLREDLNVMEETAALGELKQFDLSDDEIAERINKSVGFVRDRLALLGLPKRIQDMLSCGSINISQAKVILEIEDEEARIAAAEFAVRLNLSAEELKGQTEHLAHRKERRHRHARAEKITFDRLSRNLSKAYSDLMAFDYDMLTGERAGILRDQAISLTSTLQETLNKISAKKSG